MATDDPQIQQAMMEAEKKAALVKKRIRHWTIEKRFDDDRFRSRNEMTAELPPLEQVQRAYILTWRKDGKAVVVRKGDPSEPWSLPTVEQDLDDPASLALPVGDDRKGFDGWLKETARELWGIQITDWYQGARLRLTSTKEATDLPLGTERFIVFFCATAGSLDDIPDDVGWSRRSITTKEFVVLLREHYAEFVEILDPVHDGYLIRQANA